MIDIALIKQADKATWNRLVEQYNQMLFNIAYNILNDRELALDIAQDALYTALKNIGSFQGDSFPAFIRWLKKITFRLAINKYHWKKLHKTKSLDEVLENDKNDDEEEETTLGDTIPARVATPLDQADANEQMRVFIETIKDLPPDEKLLFRLRYVQGMKYEEIAKMQNKPLSTIKVQFFRLHNKIRKTVGKKN